MAHGDAGIGTVGEEVDELDELEEDQEGEGVGHLVRLCESMMFSFCFRSSCREKRLRSGPISEQQNSVLWLSTTTISIFSVLARSSPVPLWIPKRRMFSVSDF